jgi:AcrR family transcriptional regulator
MTAVTRTPGKTTAKVAAKSKLVLQGGRKRTAPPQPSFRKPAYRTGRQTQESIVAAAETVLVRFGHTGFTLKRVAECAGIAVGNLSYHFPTKDSLLELLINQTLTEYASRFATLIPQHPASTTAVLGELVAWFMEDSVTPRYTHLFRELWAAALHSPSLNAALEHFYEQSIEAVVNVVAPSFDARKRAELKTLVYFMCVLSEGSSVVFGSRQHPVQVFTDLKAVAVRAVTSLAESLVAPG